MPSDTQNKAMERFRTEAQAAARLDHENIVTVYEVGEANGQPYFSMQLVAGASLADVLRDGPLEPRVAVGYMLQVAEALDEAHTAGVLHRDLKPHNIMLDEKHNRVLVADFGLAKLLEGNAELTRDGEVMGTPSYMSPEQAGDSAHVTAHADIYAVGATLYHLLIGRPPFQAATIMETLRQVTDEEPVAPSQLNSAIDRDLETICLKCLEKEPPRRYDTARLLADDLARYLDRKPILARPISGWERAIRWCRRNPRLASAFGLSIGLSIAIVFVIIGSYISLSAKQATTLQALEDSKQSNRQARDTVDFFFTKFSEDVLLGQPGMQPLREELLRKALEHYQKFLGRHSDDESMQAELAMAEFRIARITEVVESPEEALVWYDLAEELQTKLLAQHPNNLNHRQALASTWNFKGSALGKLKRWNESLSAFDRAVELRGELIERSKKNSAEQREFQREFANTLMNIGIVYRAGGELEKAQAQYEAAQKLRSKLDHEKDVRVARDTAIGFYNLAKLSMEQQDLIATEQHLQSAAPILEELADSQPEDQANSRRLASCYRLLGQNRVTLSQSANEQQREAALNDALDYFQSALSISYILAYANPKVPEYQEDLAANYLDLGIVQAFLLDLDNASISLIESCKILESLEPPSAPVIDNLATSYRELGRVQVKLAQGEEAKMSLEKSHGYLKQLQREFPKFRDVTGDIRVIESELAEATDRL